MKFSMIVMVIDISLLLFIAISLTVSKIADKRYKKRMEGDCAEILQKLEELHNNNEADRTAMKEKVPASVWPEFNKSYDDIENRIIKLRQRVLDLQNPTI